CTFTLRNHEIDLSGEYIDLSEFKGNRSQPVKTREAVINPDLHFRFNINQKNYLKLPGLPIAYWTTSKVIKLFENEKSLGRVAEPRQGIKTLDNNRFLKLWYEVNNNKLYFNAKNLTDAKQSDMKWFPYNKGGMFRK